MEGGDSNTQQKRGSAATLDGSVNAVGTGPCRGVYSYSKRARPPDARSMPPPPKYARITYQTEGRTFDRLFKGTSSILWAAFLCVDRVHRVQRTFFARNQSCRTQKAWTRSCCPHRAGPTTRRQENRLGRWCVRPPLLAQFSVSTSRRRRL